MKIFTVIVALSLICLNGFANEVAANAMEMDCSNMSEDMQQFASQLSSQNKMMFCGQFNDAQRAEAMQMAGQPDESGAMMTANGAVQKVSSGSKMGPPQQTPRGCPVK